MIDPLKEEENFLNEFEYQANRPNLKLFSDIRIDLSNLLHDFSINLENTEPNRKKIKNIASDFFDINPDIEDSNSLF